MNRTVEKVSCKECTFGFSFVKIPNKLVCFRDSGINDPCQFFNNLDDDFCIFTLISIMDLDELHIVSPDSICNENCPKFKERLKKDK